MNPRYPEVSERAQKRCEYCHAPSQAFNFPFEIEHILPVSRGGDDTPDNLALACRSCNAFESTRRAATDPQTETTVPLYHPRKDRWEDQFAIDAHGVTLLSTTSTGRATIITLMMNSEEQMLARRQLKRLGLFP